jgi:hypothetical protein
LGNAHGGVHGQGREERGEGVDRHEVGLLDLEDSQGAERYGQQPRQVAVQPPPDGV